MTLPNQALLVNILGHAAGALIFAIFLVLLFSGRGWSGNRGRYLPALAAVLSLAWNLGSLAVLAWPEMPSPLLDLVVALSFSVLSLLPAVLLHVSVEGSRPLLVRLGYILSGVTIVMHFWEIAGNGAALHQWALLVITAGFLFLAAMVAAGPALSGRPGGFRVLASMCLALFATSFIHFGTGHASHAWSSELIVHHAGIPLALFVLLQDYRFVLLDAFVRFLASALLAAILSALAIAAAFRLALVDRPAQSPLHQALLLTSVCLLLVLFAWLRGRVQRWLTQAVFRRDALSGLAARVHDCPAFASEGEFLDWAASRIAAAAGTKDFAVTEPAELGAATALHAPVLVDWLSALRSSPKWAWAEAVVPVRRGPGDLVVILLGSRHGGQRYLSEDLDALGRAAAEVSEHIEALRKQEMNRLVNQAELRALQSQINPHFLFNALNTLYGSIPREAAGARRMVLNLADIFRYFLQSERAFVPLSKELQIVRAYLEVEQLRLGPRLRTEFHIDSSALEIPVPVLSIQPLVENAIKHGIAPNPEPGYVCITVKVQNNHLLITVENSSADTVAQSAGPGVGLANVRRRLEICCGGEASIELACNVGKTTAAISMPIAPLASLERTG
jgi:hypothetical protein